MNWNPDMAYQSSPTQAKRGGVVALLTGVMSCFMLFGPLGLFINAFWDAQHQHWMNETFVSVEATVLSSQVTSSKAAKGAVHYHAEIRYQYDAAGKTCISDRLTPLPSWGTEGWAAAVVARYKAGETCRAYHNADNPGEAMLMRSHSFTPYLDMLVGALLLTGGIFVVVQIWIEMWRDKRRRLAPASSGWFEVLPEFCERARMRTAQACTAAWYGLGAVAAAHYFTCVPSPHPNVRVWCFEIFALIGLIPLGLLIRRLQIHRNLAEAHLLVEQPVAHPGMPFRLAISQQARRQLQAKDIRVKLLCLGRKGKGRRILFEAVPVELKDRVLRPSETMDLPAEVTLPANSRPTGRDTTREFDRIEWELRLDCRFAGAPGYHVKFPVEVQAGPARPQEPVPVQKPRGQVDVRPVEAEFAGRILSKRNIAIMYSITLLLLFIQLSGVAMMVSVFLVIFPDNSGSKPFLNLPKPQAEIVFGVGAVLTAVVSIYGLMFPSRLSGGYLHSLARRNISRRRDAIVQPGADSLWVDIIPQTNWNRLMLENAADVGFLRVDAARREILFEGDRQRYRIPADALLSCELEKTYYSQSARANAPGFWMVVIRASGPGGVWEAPILPRSYKQRISTKARLLAAQALQEKIKALLPTSAQLPENPAPVEHLDGS